MVHPKMEQHQVTARWHLAQIQGIVYSHLLYLLCDFTKHPTGAVLGCYKGNLCVDMTNLSYLGPSPSRVRRKRRLGAGTSVAVTSQLIRRMDEM